MALTQQEIKWAYGDINDETPLKDLPENWNKLHPDLFQITKDDGLIKTERRIKQEYMKAIV